jgi:hypothetical protein
MTEPPIAQGSTRRTLSTTHIVVLACMSLRPLVRVRSAGGGGGVRAAARFGKKKRSPENRTAPPPVSHLVDVSISSRRHLWLMV